LFVKGRQWRAFVWGGGREGGRDGRSTVRAWYTSRHRAFQCAKTTAYEYDDCLLVD
jgi:hypothetical protein